MCVCIGCVMIIIACAQYGLTMRVYVCVSVFVFVGCVIIVNACAQYGLTMCVHMCVYVFVCVLVVL